MHSVLPPATTGASYLFGLGEAATVDYMMRQAETMHQILIALYIKMRVNGKQEKELCAEN